MATRVDNDLPANWADAKLPPLTPAQLDQASTVIETGGAPVPPKAPQPVDEAITSVAHDTFVSGMGLAFTVAGVVAVVAALVATLTKRGANAGGPTGRSLGEGAGGARI